MPWEPAQSSSRASNRWRPPSPSPATPALPSSTLKRESWRPTSSWTPASRPDRSTQPGPPIAESSQSASLRVPMKTERASLDRAQASPSYRTRDLRPELDESGTYDQRGSGSRRDKRGGGGDGGSDRTWEAWNNKIGAVSAGREHDDRRAGPSRRDGYSNLDRIREKEDQAAGRSWSAWKSKVGTGPDDRDRRQTETTERERLRADRDKEEGWKPKNNGGDDGRRTGHERRWPEESRAWGTRRDSSNSRSKIDVDDQEEGIPPARPGVDDRKDKNTLPYSPASRSPSPPPRRRPLSPVPRRRDESPNRGTARRASPEYGRAPIKSRRSPSPPPKRPGPDRGSPDYALGTRSRDRSRHRSP